MPPEQALSNKVAVITGAGRGIGRSIALGYARAGAAVGCVARSQSEIEATAAEIEAAGGRATARAADVCDEAAVTGAFDHIAGTLGGIDLLVVNAGVQIAPGPVAESDALAWRTTVETNLIGAYHCVRAAVPHLRARGGGKIITLGSGLGHRGLPGGSAYACSKAGLWMLTRVLAQELADDGISVNELVPGPVATGLLSSVPRRSGVGPSASTEWLKDPEDVVPLALFLATQPDKGPTAQSFSLMRRDG